MKQYQVIIIGGSFAGLSAAMTLGRLKKSVLVIDTGQPCNLPARHVQNLLMLDGRQRSLLVAEALSSLEQYETVERLIAVVVSLTRRDELWIAAVAGGQEYRGERVLFCTGLTDILPCIKGLDACWGKTVVHCPYCHAYEMKGRVGIMGSGLVALATAYLIRNLGLEVFIFSDKVNYQEQYSEALAAISVPVYHSRIAEVQHTDGWLQAVVHDDGTHIPLDFLFVETEAAQQSPIPQALGCMLTSAGLIAVNEYQETSVAGVYAAGDCCNPIRYTAVAMADGTKAATFILQDLNSSVIGGHHH